MKVDGGNKNNKKKGAKEKTKVNNRKRSANSKQKEGKGPLKSKFVPSLVEFGTARSLTIACLLLGHKHTQIPSFLFAFFPSSPPLLVPPFLSFLMSSYQSIPSFLPPLFIPFLGSSPSFSPLHTVSSSPISCNCISSSVPPPRDEGQRMRTTCWNG